VPAGGYVGKGECEATAIATIAAFICPMSSDAPAIGNERLPSGLTTDL
jgi:hypothetical protein